MGNDAKPGLKPGIRVEMPEHALTAGTAENQYGISFRDLNLESGTVIII
jgi:hypothetical protein